MSRCKHDPEALARALALVDGGHSQHAAAELTGVPAHRAGVVLGSGWGPASDALGEPLATLPMAEVTGRTARLDRPLAGADNETLPVQSLPETPSPDECPHEPADRSGP